MLTTSLSIGLGAAMAAATGVITFRQLKALVPMDITLWPFGWPHEPPDHPLSVPEAHQAMQKHRDCRREDCARKNAAYLTLVVAGRLKPDAGRVQ